MCVALNRSCLPLVIAHVFSVSVSGGDVYTELEMCARCAPYVRARPGRAKSKTQRRGRETYELEYRTVYTDRDTTAKHARIRTHFHYVNL